MHALPMFASRATNQGCRVVFACFTTAPSKASVLAVLPSESQKYTKKTRKPPLTFTHAWAIFPTWAILLSEPEIELASLLNCSSIPSFLSLCSIPKKISNSPFYLLMHFYSVLQADPLINEHLTAVASFFPVLSSPFGCLHPSPNRPASRRSTVALVPVRNSPTRRSPLAHRRPRHPGPRKCRPPHPTRTISKKISHFPLYLLRYFSFLQVDPLSKVHLNTLASVLHFNPVFPSWLLPPFWCSLPPTAFFDLHFLLHSHYCLRSCLWSSCCSTDTQPILLQES